MIIMKFFIIPSKQKYWEMKVIQLNHLNCLEF